MKRGEDSPEYVRNRKKLQRHKMRYMELREELMLAGEIPVEPSGAIRDERVDPASQEAQSIPALVREAIRRGWAVPEDKKPQLVDELISILESPHTKAKEKIASFSALAKADWNQYQQEHPNKAAGTSINVQVNVFDDIERDIKLLAVDAAPAGGIQADCDAQPLDATQPTEAQAAPEADRLPDAV